MPYKKNLAERLHLNSRKSVIYLIIMVLVLLGGSAVAYNKYYRNPDSGSDQNNGDNANINFSPPTNEEKKETEEHKEEIANPPAPVPNPTPGPSPQLKAVTPIITSWGTNSNNNGYIVSAFIPGIVENGGTCTLKATLGANTPITKTTSAENDASSTTCSNFLLSRSDFLAAGNWSVKVSYSSSTSSGTSSAVELKVD